MMRAGSALLRASFLSTWAVLGLDEAACASDRQRVTGLHAGDTVTGELTPDELASPADFSGYPGDGAVPASDGSIEGDSGHGVDAGATPAAGGPTNADTYTLDLSPGQSVQVVMCRADQDSVLDPYLVVDLRGVHVLSDDDSAGGLDARVQIDAGAAGRYTVYATVVTGRVAPSGGHAYTLRVANTDPTQPLECRAP